MQIGETTLHARGLLRIINEVLQASWSAALKKIVNESMEVREGAFEMAVALWEVIAEAVSLIEARLRIMAQRVIKVINETVVVYDSITRLVAKAIKGIVQVVADGVGLVDSVIRKKVKSRFITKWKDRFSRR